MPRTICVYASSSDAVNSAFQQLGKEFGMSLGKRGETLIYGGANMGLMHIIAENVQKSGGKVIGVIPRVISEKEKAYKGADELIITNDLYERKALMVQRGDAFVIFPGGFGTLDEAMDVLVQKNLQLHNKPIVFLNYAHCFDGIKTQFEQFIQQNFAKSDAATMYHFAESINAVWNYLDHYQPIMREQKWFK